MRTAIITGASSGLGREYALQVREAFPEIERVWLIARRAERLAVLSSALGVETEALALDLCRDEGMKALEQKLAEEKPEVTLLVNCAGCGFLRNVADTDPELLQRMCDLNMRAVTLVTRLTVPYMPDGGHIVNISSIASFCPNPRMTVYSSSKAYVSSFSLGLRDELRDRHISVTAVCPGPMATEFLDVGGIAGNSKMFKTLPYCDPKKVAAGSYAAAKRNQAVYTPRVFFKIYRVLAKVIPHTVLVRLART